MEGIRLLNTDIESRIEEFLKKELSIANLDNVVVIDGGRQPIGSLLPIKVLIISSAWLLMLFFNFAKKPKLAWSAIAVLCGAFAIVPDRLWLEPDYESPLASQAMNTASTPRSLHSAAPVTPPTQPRNKKEGSTPSLEKLRQDAERGNAYAQYDLGHAYEIGYVAGFGDVPKDTVEAVKWYRKAADHGHIEAQNILGAMYQVGYGVPKDDAEAVKWFRKAAEQGNAFGQSALGFRYETGEGVPKDVVEAVKWYRKAAEQGDVTTQNTLGDMFKNGDGVTKDAVEAVRWYRKAAERGNGIAQLLMGIMHEQGSGVPKDEVEALAWYNIASASGSESWHTTGREARTLLEKRLGPQVSLLAQQRSKEILKEIQAAKAKGARVTQAEQPGEADRDEPPKRGQSGTGVFVTTDGLILTAAHVVKGVSSIEIQTSHGVKPGRLVKVDTKNDLALIKCEGKFQPAPVKASRDVKLGQAVFTIGFPNVELQGVRPKMTRGEISGLAGLRDDPRQWQISVPVQPGNSGGPLYDEAGNVIGVIVAKLNAIKAAKFTGDLSQNVNYAVKSAPALQLLAPYIEKMAVR